MISEVISAAVVWSLVVLGGFLVLQLRRGVRRRRWELLPPGTRPEPRTHRHRRWGKP
jgi:hypothetical protein